MPESVSILIPTHNRSAILLRALESLRAVQVPPQTTVELLVIANGCTDRTRAAVDGIAAQMPFPTRVLDEPELGLNRARNRGLGAARGSIVAFLDDDVWVEPGWLAGLLEIFATRPADLVAGVVNLWWEAVPRPEWMTTRSEHLLSCVNY